MVAGAQRVRRPYSCVYVAILRQIMVRRLPAREWVFTTPRDAQFG